MQGGGKEMIMACSRSPDSSFLAKDGVSQSCCVGSKEREVGWAGSALAGSLSWGLKRDASKLIHHNPSGPPCRSNAACRMCLQPCACWGSWLLALPECMVQSARVVQLWNFLFTKPNVALTRSSTHWMFVIGDKEGQLCHSSLCPQTRTETLETTITRSTCVSDRNLSSSALTHVLL